MESFIAAMFVKMLNFLFEFAKKHKLDRGASINGDASEPFVWNGRTYRLITLKISAGSLPSRFTKIETNGVLYRVPKEHKQIWRPGETRFHPGEQLPNPFEATITVNPGEKPLVNIFYAEAAKEGATKVIFKGKYEELEWFQSL